MVCGWLTATEKAFLDGSVKGKAIPVPAYVIEHPKGIAVYDTGISLRAVDEPSMAVGAGFADLFNVIFTPGDDLGARLEALHIDPAKVDFVINSHMHNDHCGGNAQLPNATLIVQAREWENASDPERAHQSKFDPCLYDLGQRVETVDGEHDLFGDGSVVLLPTFGHTAGHQSLRLRGAGGETVLTADCCLFHSVLESERVPPSAYDKDAQVRAIRKLRAMRDRGTRLVCGHDPSDWTQAEKGILALM